ncbi:SpvB/TcaC N-terminal domain-containing protein [Kitasatospora sp. NPDC058965]|uniref:SpvB/TcaC N-terminal domain-containing protein n=1 Tax=Kitasatospora sp. NPDC058965 TaxID=3346682 RepID=UPI0036CD6C5D
MTAADPLAGSGAPGIRFDPADAGPGPGSPSPPGAPAFGPAASGPATADSAGSGLAAALPTVNLPTGGGAIRGIGEKFGTDAVTGTGTFVVPVDLTSGRGGFGPQLALSYDSGAGNGPFGLGWSLSLPAVTRRTDKGLPRYDDAHESDVFVLSAAEDLVPTGPPRRIGEHEVRRYRPRIDVSFARIERWTRIADPADVHWRSISPDNVLTLYGTDPDSRIADPRNPRNVFSWLISETRDDCGNVVRYDYLPDDDPRGAAQRYLKRIRYGNATPLLGADGTRPRFVARQALHDLHWFFEAVLDYGDHGNPGDHGDPGGDSDRTDDGGGAPTPRPERAWPMRDDPFSSYRPGFELRTTRLCRRILMFHHFPDEPGVGRDCLVAATELTHSPPTDPATVARPAYSMLRAVTQAKYRRTKDGYLRRALPPVELAYSEAVVAKEVRTVDPAQLAQLPTGLDGRGYRWVDLHGEGVPGLLTEQGGCWYYLPNLSGAEPGTEPAPEAHDPGEPAEPRRVRFGPRETVGARPNQTLAGGARLMDLSGDGRLDLVTLDGPVTGLYEHDEQDGWHPFRPFPARLNRDTRDPELRLVDLDGDGLPDVLIAEGDDLVWHPGLGSDGFGPARRVPVPGDERYGPRVVFTDPTQGLLLADMTGDGLSDLVRIRNGDICYWPNLGHGRFGARVTLRNVPRFDSEFGFSPDRVRLADIDGSGTSDVVYLHADGPRLYFNQSGGCLSRPHRVTGFPITDEVGAVDVIDLFGNGTACLVWSTPLPAELGRQLRYVDLMGAKPHLLVRSVNNLGAETRVRYRSSTWFYLTDKAAGRPWITRSPFPVQVVERVESIDHLSRHRFSTRYAYHHQYFDAAEREPRGFGMVEQWDTEEFADLAGRADEGWCNLGAVGYAPPLHTKTWFHTGVYLGRERISDYFTGRHGPGEYYREPHPDGLGTPSPYLPDTALPPGLGFEEQREACRALKGLMLRQETYGLDGTDRARHPYTVVEQNFTVRMLQPRGSNRHAVFLTHPRERLTHAYERNPADPRTEHAVTVTVDDYGHVLDELAVAYPRRAADRALPLDADRAEQARTVVTSAHNVLTSAVDTVDSYRVPLPAEASSYEITGAVPEDGHRFGFAEWSGARHPMAAVSGRRRRLIDRARTLYRPDDLGAATGDPLALLPLGALQARALPGLTLRLAFDDALLDRALRRDGAALLPDRAPVLREGGYRSGHELAAAGVFPPDDPAGQWWIPTGRSFLSPRTETAADRELAFARAHFFRPLRHRDPFQDGVSSPDSEVGYDRYDLLVVDSTDPLGNRTTVGERRPDGTRDPDAPGADYRLLKPVLVTDANGNRAAAALDTLGLLAATAAMGKRDEQLGDSLDGLDPAFLDAPPPDGEPADTAAVLLRGATRRLLYDVSAFERTRDLPRPLAPSVRTVVRETHTSELPPGAQSVLHNSFAYFDGSGREVQRKTEADADPGEPDRRRWIGSGWTEFNNKGAAVRVFEPFFSDTHGFEFGAAHGVSTIRFYDAASRVVATLFADHSYAKTVFDPWRRSTWDRNDTVLADPRTDPDTAGPMAGYFRTAPPDWRTWYAERIDGGLGTAEQAAAVEAAAHADTPDVVHLDPLGRIFLSRRQTGFGEDGAGAGAPVLLDTRIERDVSGNVLAVRDPVPVDERGGRIVARTVFDLLGRVLRREAMDAGTRWTLADVEGAPLRRWDSRGHTTRSVHDPLRRQVQVLVTGADRRQPDREVVVERTVYGERVPGAADQNLRGRVLYQLDQSGSSRCHAYDFKGNPLRSTRRIAAEYREVVDWSLPGTGDADLPAAAEHALEPAAFEADSRFDALNRPVLLTTPSEPGSAPSTIRYGYGRSGLLDRLDVRIEADTDAEGVGDPQWTAVLREIRYNARGQRVRVVRGNDAVTEEEYDPLTFRLRRTVSRQAGGERVQDLGYTYDAAGNIVRIDDRAHQPVFFRNRHVPAGSSYRYDGTYRLVEATGREQLGQAGRARPWPPQQRAGGSHPGDGNALARYTERYQYDAAGNLRRVTHRGQDPARAGWTRTYEYTELPAAAPVPSAHAESAAGPDAEAFAGPAWRVGNRLSSTITEGERPAVEHYAYDAHGNTTALPHLAGLAWNYRDQLAASQRQSVSEERASEEWASDEERPAGAERTWYVYDAAGNRTRKVTELAGGAVKEDNSYLGGVEFTRLNTGPHRGLVRTGLDVSDGRQTLARIVTRNEVDDGSSARLVRHQLANHLKSTTVELDGAGRVISYEEYSPYGSSTYQAVRAETGAPKRDRFIGRERDGETGLYCVGARYYAPWLGRWISCDPSGLRDSTDLYVYAGDDPVNSLDENGAWEISWRDVAIGAGVAALTVAAVVVVVASAGTAAPGLAAAAAGALGVSETTLVTGVAVAGTSLGVAGTINTAGVVATGRTANGRVLSDQERSRRLGALPVEAVATVFGMRGISIGGGGGGAGPAAEFVSVGNGTAALRPPAISFSLPQIVANSEAIAPALASTITPVVTALTGGGGGGGGSSGGGEQGPPPEQPAAQQSSSQPAEPNSSQQPPADSTAGPSSTEPLASLPEVAASEAPPPATTGPRATLGSSTTTNYKKTFFAANPEAEGQVVVHHAVEQQAANKLYPGEVSESQLHSLENLRGIPKGEVNNTVHLSRIRKIWNEFYRTHPNATQEELLDQATKIDDQFGASFVPPVRPPVSSGGQ